MKVGGGPGRRARARGGRAAAGGPRRAGSTTPTPTRLRTAAAGAAPRRRARSTVRLDAALDPAWSPPSPACPTPGCLERARSRCGSTARSPPTPPGTSCSRGRFGGLAGRRGAPRPTSPTWASTSSTCRPSTRSARRTARAGTTRSPPAPTTRAARGPSARPRAATTPSTPTSARSTTSTPSSPGPSELGLEVALDYALQCSPDHPWVHEHPEWFQQRPDGSIRYAENPPKKYQDIHPIEFWPADEADRVALWERVPRRARALDRPRRPHVPRRQPAHEAARVLGVGHRRRPQPPPRRACSSPRRSRTPAMMAKLAEVGFTQSYTYFTWRHDGVGAAGVRRPSSPRARWPTTCARPSGPTRPTSSTVRCATGRRPRSRCGSCSPPRSCPIYGIYSGYELSENEPASETNDGVPALREVRAQGRATTTTRLAGAADPHASTPLRRRHPACGALRDVRFHHADDEHFLVYSRGHVDRDLLLVRRQPRPARGAGHDRPPRPRRPRPARRSAATSCTTSSPARPTCGAATSAYVRLDPTVGQVAHLLHVTR